MNVCTVAIIFPIPFPFLFFSFFFLFFFFFSLESIILQLLLYSPQEPINLSFPVHPHNTHMQISLAKAKPQPIQKPHIPTLRVRYVEYLHFENATVSNIQFCQHHHHQIAHLVGKVQSNQHNDNENDPSYLACFSNIQLQLLNQRENKTITSSPLNYNKKNNDSVISSWEK